jgi:hypothetical protein
LADLIVDLVESGSTLKANGLVPLGAHLRHQLAAGREQGVVEDEARLHARHAAVHVRLEQLERVIAVDPLGDAFADVFHQLVLKGLDVRQAHQLAHFFWADIDIDLDVHRRAPAALGRGGGWRQKVAVVGPFFQGCHAAKSGLAFSGGSRAAATRAASALR